MQYKVVMTDHVYPDLALESKAFAEAGAEFVYLDTKEEKLIASAVADADAVITCYASINADIIKTMRKCRSISKTGIGVNNIDVEQATKQGIRVLNVPDYCIEEVSDATVAQVLALTRRIPFLWDKVRDGEWSLEGNKGISRLNGKTMGFLGFGRIARRAAEKMKPFGVKIIAYDPYVTQESVAGFAVEMVDLEKLFSDADILSLNVPLSAETQDIINKDALKKMKKSAIIVNTARGPLINEANLCDAIREGEIAGAALDVICTETYDERNPLFSLPNVVITPHAAFYSVESTQELREKVLADVLAILEGNAPKYQVNKL